MNGEKCWCPLFSFGSFPKSGIASNFTSVTFIGHMDIVHVSYVHWTKSFWVNQEYHIYFNTQEKAVLFW